MDTKFLNRIRSSLEEKRQSLTDWLQTAPESNRQQKLGPENEQAVQQYLEVIEDSMEKAEEQTLGVCTVCHEYVDSRLLEMDYTACVCLDHLSDQELRNLEFELELAQSVQQSLLQQVAPPEGVLMVSAFSRPAQIVSGDLYDFFQFQDGSHGLAIADVAGHGVSASLQMASVQTLLRTLAPIHSTPDAVLQQMQHVYSHNIRFNSFVTIFLAAYDPQKHSLKYSNAGHNPALVVEQIGNGSSMHWLWPNAAAIGLTEDNTFTTQEQCVEAGDLIVLYTDGIPEASNWDNDMFGRDRLADLVYQNRSLPVDHLTQVIRQDLSQFTGGKPLADDATLVVCRIPD